jgi:hypothetical protein
VSRHAVDLFFAPVVVFPAVMAWSAMAAYGYHLMGPAGLTLPAVSEGGMWVFEARFAWTVKNHPDRPTWHLRLGAWIFAGVGAALNFSHGVTKIPGSTRPHGVAPGTVMAIISVAGLAAHQLVTAGPRQSRLARAMGRREQAIQRAVVKRSPVIVDKDGAARVVVDPGTFTLTRRHGRLRLDKVTEAEPVVWLPWPVVRSGAEAMRQREAQADEAVTAYRDWRTRTVDGLSALTSAAVMVATDSQPLPIPFARPALPDVANDADARQAEDEADQRSAARGGGIAPTISEEPHSDPESDSEPTSAPATAPAPRRSAGRRPTGQRRARKLTTAEVRQKIAAAEPGTSNADLAKATGRSERTVRRLRNEGVPELAAAGREGG